jgi:hypothetical protein
MATLTSDELTLLRRGCGFSGAAPTKVQANAALQAIEDTMVTRALVAGDVTKTIAQVVSGQIDASSAYSWSNAQKKTLFAWWALNKYTRDK